MEWSEWHPLTMDDLKRHEARCSGVYRIALRDGTIAYPNGSSPVLFIGEAPLRRLTERLQDHLRGWGNSGVYERNQNGEALQWQNYAGGDLAVTAAAALEEFISNYGTLPVDNHKAPQHKL